jgi:hypothetical protein
LIVDSIVSWNPLESGKKVSFKVKMTRFSRRNLGRRGVRTSGKQSASAYEEGGVKSILHEEKKEEEEEEEKTRKRRRSTKFQISGQRTRKYVVRGLCVDGQRVREGPVKRYLTTEASVELITAEKRAVRSRIRAKMGEAGETV